MPGGGHEVLVGGCRAGHIDVFAALRPFASLDELPGVSYVELRQVKEGTSVEQLAEVFS